MEHNKLRDPDYYLEINKFSDLVSCLSFYLIDFRFYFFVVFIVLSISKYE